MLPKESPKKTKTNKQKQKAKQNKKKNKNRIIIYSQKKLFKGFLENVYSI